MRMFTTLTLFIWSYIKLIIVDIIYSIQQQVSLIRDHMRRLYNNRSEDAKYFLKNIRQRFALLNEPQI